jgi:hypothetical protein
MKVRSGCGIIARWWRAVVLHLRSGGTSGGKG